MPTHLSLLIEDADEVEFLRSVWVFGSQQLAQHNMENNFEKFTMKI